MTTETLSGRDQDYVSNPDSGSRPPTFLSHIEDNTTWLLTDGVYVLDLDWYSFVVRLTSTSCTMLIDRTWEFFTVTLSGRIEILVELQRRLWRLPPTEPLFWRETYSKVLRGKDGLGIYRFLLFLFVRLEWGGWLFTFLRDEKEYSSTDRPVEYVS